MTLVKLKNHKITPVIFIVVSMIIICEYVLEYSYTGHYFSVSMIKWLLFAIPEITLDVILCFILCFAYKLEEGMTVILILSVAFGIDALFLSSNIISVLSSIQIKENEAIIIKNACNISFVYFLRHFSFIVLIYVAGLNYTPKINKKNNLSLFVMVAAFTLIICILASHSDNVNEYRDILLSSRSLFFLSALWLSLLYIYIPKNHSDEKYSEIINFFIISNITCNFLLIATEDAGIITWYIGRGVENLCKLVTLVIICIRTQMALHNVIECSRRDYLTGFFQYSLFSKNMPRSFSVYEKRNTNITMISCKICNLDALYVNKGVAVGDNAVKNIANVLISNASQMDTIIRIRENTFVMLMPFSSTTALQIQHRQIKSSIVHTIKAMDMILDVDVSYQVINLSKITLEQAISNLISKYH
ncbi:diguanylate cyclase [Escherichia sp. E4742]|nr:diguanylate cyclase [Escherichia sp. E4742]TLJ07243.1 diguanylate cyclase [Escherichia sp. E4742]